MTETKKLVSVDQTLAFADNSMPQTLIDAWSYTTTFAQAHARKVNPDPSTEKYFQAMTEEFQKLAWNVTTAGKLDYTQSANEIKPADIVSSIINPYLTPDQKTALNGILSAIQQPTSGVNDFVTFWWNKAKTQASKTTFAFGPLTEVNNSSNITMVYYNFNFDAESWRSLFVGTSTADLVTSVYNLEMNLNSAFYEQIKGDIISKIVGKEKEHIQETQLDL